MLNFSCSDMFNTAFVEFKNIHYLCASKKQFIIFAIVIVASNLCVLYYEKY